MSKKLQHTRPRLNPRLWAQTTNADLELSPYAIKVRATIAIWYRDYQTKNTPLSDTLLADLCHCSRPTIRKAERELEARGRLEVTRAKGRPNVYTLLDGLDHGAGSPSGATADHPSGTWQNRFQVHPSRHPRPGDRVRRGSN